MKHDKNPERLLNHNNLLRALKPAEKDLLLPYMAPYPLRKGEALYEPGDDVQYAYFPCNTALISFMVMLADARAVETALIGREGAVGGIVSHGHLPAFCRAEVRFPGLAVRIASRDLEQAKNAFPSISNLFTRYADCLISQVFQAVACNATHTIEQRLAKWFLAAITRTDDHDIPITQEQLASMLGVGRSYVARVMAGFKTNGSISTHRGHMIVNNPDRLREMSCGCNALVHDHFDTVLRGIYPADT
ncbi:Crp/Fnr family transcriptional regulator [Kordiimonas aestuarii]|uniref:Crp/Fnr family transcriptional regulator n=1 Tax=Kordiimonas aestuarii TaxID=1005925 RepID=UPI0021D32E97|nr:Crp/Fnr family transcriptional regulator [Kordiimonas aestuarii]